MASIKKDSRNISKSIVKERFRPVLNDTFSESFKILLVRFQHSLPINHREFIVQEINETKEYICIVMSTLIQRTDQEILMSFVASCIEDAAERLGLDYAEVYGRMKAVGMIENYIIPHYDVLHTESRANVTNGIIDTLKRWEEQ